MAKTNKTNKTNGKHICIKYCDYLEYVPLFERQQCPKYYKLKPKKYIYNRLEVGDFISIETEPAPNPIYWNPNPIYWNGEIVKKYKNGDILVYEF